MNRLVSCIAIAMSLFSCQDFTDEYHYYVAPELETFVNHFYAEAKKRGLNLRMDGLSVSLQDPGYANAGETLDGSLIVYIKPSFVYDHLGLHNHVDSLWVEWVVFHELGHGLLYEIHRNGESIMNAHNEHINQYSNNEKARQQMVSELFAHYE